ncbi:MAG: hypothetical protein EOO38_18305 [Cytophagaceae bacterium]|nr:MAG: hypothetical protein EOO38_18305 [Cytophagaceae bacterium]
MAMLGQRDVETLRTRGLVPGEYIVLHIGARHKINRWPLDRFIELCRRLLSETSYGLVIFADHEEDLLIGIKDDRVKILGLIEPGHFDQIVSNARLLVGNDSGPKHLAAVRGIPTVSIHVDRLNWNEWGQDGIGKIISKHLPCTGCGLNDIALCGRDAVCVTSIKVDEVIDAMAAYL